MSELLFHHRVYDVLVRTCDAPDDEVTRLQWDAFWMGDGDEFRFCGALGFGGKFRRTRTGWSVSYYPEDETPDRRNRAVRAYAALGILENEWLDDAVGELEG